MIVLLHDSYYATNWKQKWKRNLLAVIVLEILVLLAFVPTHPRALPVPNFLIACFASLGLYYRQYLCIGK